MQTLKIESGVGEIQDSVGYRLPLATIILISGWLPVTTGYHNFGLTVVPVTKFDDLHWLPSVTNFLSEAGVQSDEI